MITINEFDMLCKEVIDEVLTIQYEEKDEYIDKVYSHIDIFTNKYKDILSNMLTNRDIPVHTKGNVLSYIEITYGRTIKNIYQIMNDKIPEEEE